MSAASGPAPGAVRLDPAARAAALRRMGEEPLDVLVIGGGVVGAGAALDAATRGLTVGLVEARDLASGTSSRSSKLVHGGLRYLEQLEFGLVREALRERSLILHRLAPHLARPIAVVVMIETIFLLSVFAEIFTTTSGGPGYESTNLAYLIYNQALLQFDVGMASAGGLIAVLIANIAAIVLVRMIGKNLTARS